MPVQSTQFSPSAWAVNKAQETFAINATDGKVKFAGKVAGRTLTNAALTVAASLETVVLAVLTAPAFVLSFAYSRPYNTLKAGTQLAGRATAEAFKGIAGYKTEVKAAPSKAAQVKALVNKYAAKAVVAGKAGFEAAKSYTVAGGKKVYSYRKGITKGAALAVAGYVAYNYGSAIAGTVKAHAPEFATNNPVVNFANDWAVQPIATRIFG